MRALKTAQSLTAQKSLEKQALEQKA